MNSIQQQEQTIKDLNNFETTIQEEEESEEEEEEEIEVRNVCPKCEYEGHILVSKKRFDELENIEHNYADEELCINCENESDSEEETYE